MSLWGLGQQGWPGGASQPLFASVGAGRGGAPWFHLLKELWVILLSCPAREPAEPMGDFRVSPQACWKG